MEVSVLISKFEDVYISECPITSVSTFGATEKEAIENHKEAMELYIEDLSDSEVEELESSSNFINPTLTKLSITRKCV